MTADTDTVTTSQYNVLGEPLESCCFDPVTGVYRDGYCHHNKEDLGMHYVCARVTRAFLEYSLQQGNDLITPNEASHFPGLKDGDRWCLCAGRWQQAHEAGVAPPVYLKSTNQRVLEFISFETLKSSAIDLH